MSRRCSLKPVSEEQGVALPGVSGGTPRLALPTSADSLRRTSEDCGGRGRGEKAAFQYVCV